jgi:hypothetical protein
MRLCDDKILVVAMIADQGETFRATWQVVPVVARYATSGNGLADQRFGPGVLPSASPGLRA